MNAFVLDNSVAMRWLLESEKASDQKYAERVLESMVDSYALTPNLWHLHILAHREHQFCPNLNTHSGLI